MISEREVAKLKPAAMELKPGRCISVRSKQGEIISLIDMAADGVVTVFVVTRVFLDEGPGL